ncbi:REP-associated tyrosine transposase [Catenovulum adriaticum]|uniref:Transposase n=1 Tax=Catenovulum adriaticum TaxID=2984846 RepID=A0ABY7AJF4_9ALTE|nr:transposase [Catenovulum sp. TS8]WAJ69362.1 transposase [Catenovulum sp. TS8]
MFSSRKRLKGRISKAFSFYSVTLCCYQRQKIFQNFDNGCVATKALMAFEQKGLVKNVCYMVMPDHLHWLFQLQGSVELSSLVKQYKSFTAVKLNQSGVTHTKIWQSNYYDHQIRQESDLVAQARYIVANPLRAGLVNRVEEYPFWDCIYL